MTTLQIPEDINPKDFFEKLLPAVYEQNKAQIPERAKSLKASLVFHLTGEQGGTWVVKYNEGNLIVAPGEDPERVVKITQTVGDFRGMISGKRGFRLELPGVSAQKPGVVATPAPVSQDKIEKLKSIDGTIMFRLTDPEKGDWTVTVKFGKSEKTEPDCTISVAAEDAKAMRKGELNPQMAFMSGKIDIKGDLGLAMQIGTTFMM